jgi:ribosomal protein L20
MNGLKKAGIELDRKVLAQMAYDASPEFNTLIEAAKRFISAESK